MLAGLVLVLVLVTCAQRARSGTGARLLWSSALLVVDTVGLFFSCQRFAQICSSSG